MGEGEGKKDVSNEIEDEDQLMGLKGDQKKQVRFSFKFSNTKNLQHNPSFFPLQISRTIRTNLKAKRRKKKAWK
jgi:hypothetical protein